MNKCEFQFTSDDVRLLIESVEGYLFEGHYHEWDEDKLNKLLKRLENKYKKMEKFSNELYLCETNRYASKLQ